VRQAELFAAGATGSTEPRWVEVDPSAVRVDGTRALGGAWLALQLINKLGLRAALDGLMPAGREDVPWPVMSLVLVICRLCNPSSELRIAEHLFERSALPDLLGVAVERVNDDRLYRALDALLPHKQSLETHLKSRLGALFGLTYDLLLYDVTSTYFEGQAEGNEQAKRGYSRDSRPDCKQVCIALVVSRCGMPVGYELFAGNKADVTTVREVVEAMEGRYGRADRVWVMDRGMVSAANIEFLKEGGRKYIVGTPKSMLRKYEKQLIASDWNVVHEGLEVKRCADPDGSDETFILCRSADRRAKEKAMHERFERRIDEGLTSLQKMAQRRAMTAVQLSHRVGRLMGQNTRAAGGFKTEVTADARGHATLAWERVPAWQSWASLSEGCYLLRSNVSDWSAADLWRAYMQLTEAEGAFRIHKGDPAGVAPEDAARAGPRAGLLPGVRAVEDAGTDVPVGRPRRRAAQGAGRTVDDPDGGRGPADAMRLGDPQEVRGQANGAPSDPVAQVGPEPAATLGAGVDVVKTFRRNRPWRYHQGRSGR